MRRRLTVGVTAIVAVLCGGGLATAASAPGLSAHGPVRLDGTSASARFEVGDRTIRQFRYADRQELGYTFVLSNNTPVPVTVTDVSAAGPRATLLGVDRLERAGGNAVTRFRVSAAGEVAVRLVLDMSNCEHVSSRAGSFLSEVTVHTEMAGVLDRSGVVALPEELHTGSPREALCPRATSTSRSPG
jgi:hypothetical protein